MKINKLKIGQTIVVSEDIPEIFETKAADPSLAPPKKWWDKMKKSGKSDALIGHIWYNTLDDSKRSEIRKREGKKYGPAQ